MIHEKFQREKRMEPAPALRIESEGVNEHVPSFNTAHNVRELKSTTTPAQRTTIHHDIRCS